MTGGSEEGEGTASLGVECGACNLGVLMMRGYVSAQETVSAVCSSRGRPAPSAADRNSGSAGSMDFCTRWLS
jgi:hypothetical protein